MRRVWYGIGGLVLVLGAASAAAVSIAAASAVAPAGKRLPATRRRSAPEAGKPAQKPAQKAAPRAPVFESPVYYSGQVIVLMYHAVDSRPIPGDVIRPSVFAQELALFRKDHLNPITLDQFCAFLAGRGRVPPNAVLITFDNGYESFYRTAFPLLRKYGDPAVLFPIVSWLEHPGRRGVFHTLTWSQVESMHRSGLVAVQSQTYNLHTGVAVGPVETEPATVGRMYNPATGARESKAAYARRVLADLVKARKLVAQHTGERDVNALSYPFGDYTPEFIHLLHLAGYRYLFTAKQGWGVLPSTSPNTLFRINSGTPNITPQGLVGTIRWIANLTRQDPGWKPPSRFVQVWSY